MSRPVRLTERARILAAWLLLPTAVALFWAAGNVIVAGIGGGHG